MTKIKITGDIIILEYCSDEKEFWDDYFQDFLWAKITSIEVDGVDIMSQKGKYIETNDHFKQFIGEGKEHPLPVEIHTGVVEEYEAFYGLDVDDFDPAKLQLMKSNEISDLRRFPIASCIMYDGKKFQADASIIDLGIGDNDYDEYYIRRI